MPEPKVNGHILLLKKVSEKTSPNPKPVPIFTTASAKQRSHFLPSSESDMFPTPSSGVPDRGAPRSESRKSRERRRRAQRGVWAHASCRLAAGPGARELMSPACVAGLLESACSCSGTGWASPPCPPSPPSLLPHSCETLCVPDAVYPLFHVIGGYGAVGQRPAGFRAEPGEGTGATEGPPSDI